MNHLVNNVFTLYLNNMIMMMINLQVKQLFWNKQGSSWYGGDGGFDFMIIFGDIWGYLWYIFVPWSGQTGSEVSQSSQGSQGWGQSGHKLLIGEWRDIFLSFISWLPQIKHLRFVGFCSNFWDCLIYFYFRSVGKPKSRSPLFQSEEGEVEVWVIFPPGKI